MARKGENIRKRKDGRWEWRLIVGYNLQGKALYKSIYGKTYSILKEKRKQYLFTPDMYANDEGINSTVKDLCIKWLNTVKISIKQSTYARYYHVIYRHIIPCIGNIKIRKLNTDILNNFISDKYENGRLDGKGDLSAKTVNDLVILLKQILKGNCTLNWDDISKPKLAKKQINTLNKEDCVRLMNHLMLALDSEKIGLILALYTGIRLGELCALKWHDIDIEKGILHINKTMQRIRNMDSDAKTKTKIIIDKPKSNSSIRDIPLQDFIIEILHDFRQQHEYRSNDYFLKGDTNKFIEPRLFQKKFKKLLEETGIKETNYHALRHTFGTMAAVNGFETKSLSDIMGHSNVKITLENYVHPNINQKRMQMEKLTFSY